MTDSQQELVEFENATSEWDNVACITPVLKGEERDDREKVEKEHLCPLITVSEVVAYIQSCGELEGYLSQVPPAKAGLVSRVFSCFRARRLPPHLRQTKRLMQATALIPFDNQEPLHLSILRSMYRQLTGSKVDCPRYGEHWEDIGFQGNDPSTDLRGVGLLGLVQALYLVTQPEMLPFARDVYRLSRSQEQEFPLAVLSLNITRITLHVLRDGILDRHLALDDDVWSTCNFFYCALLYHLYARWKGEFLTISKSGYVLQETEQFGRKYPSKTFSRFEKFLQTEYSVAEKQRARDYISKQSNKQTDLGAIQGNPV